MTGPECWNQEAEEAVVGALFLDENLIKETTIQPEQLYSWKLRQLYSAMRSLDDKGKPIDVVTIVDELGTDTLLAIGGVSYIMQLAGSVPTTANFSFYERLVKEYDQKRKAIRIGTILIQQAHTNEISRAVSQAIQSLLDVEEVEVNEDDGGLCNSLVDIYIDSEKDLGDIVGIPSGFSHLDRLTGGFTLQDYVIIGARPSMGKTAFALRLALEAAIQDVGIIFSLEMGRKQLVKRLVSSSGKINSLRMKNPKREFEDEDWNQFASSIGILSKLNLRIFDQAGMDVQYIRSKVRQVRKEYGDDKRLLVVIDYLQLIQGDPRNKQNRQIEISEISRALKTMAKELNVVIVALSQLSRGVESRQDKRPILSDLRDSGQIEQDADLIAFLYRDDYYSKDTIHKDKMEIILAKHRNGPIGTVEVGFHKEYGQFVDLD